MNEKLEAQAKHLDEIADELEKAVAHAKTAAAHFRSGEVPRGCAIPLRSKGTYALLMSTCGKLPEYIVLRRGLK